MHQVEENEIQVEESDHGWVSPTPFYDNQVSDKQPFWQFCVDLQIFSNLCA